MINVTEKAKEKVAEIMDQEGKSGTALRVSVHGGGCSGFQYGLNFADSSGPADEVLDCGRFSIYVDPISAQYLQGAVLDYVDGLNGSGFKITNPNAKGTCGCGNSFNA